MAGGMLRECRGLNGTIITDYLWEIDSINDQWEMDTIKNELIHTIIRPHPWRHVSFFKNMALKFKRARIVFSNFPSTRSNIQ